MKARKPNILFIMTDQQRFDTIAALGNSLIYTPNLDRLAARGIAFTNAYSTCPVCVPARYTIRTGCEPPSVGLYENGCPKAPPGAPSRMEERCGPYLAREMVRRGYRTFGVGKFHTVPWDEDPGYEIHLHSEELYGSPDQRRRDDFSMFIREQHPEFNHVEMLQGERSEMYYVPQLSPLPAALTVESWAADRAVELIASPGKKPFFGMVSFIGPHPPCAPPAPFNRMYDPDRMPEPVCGRKPLDWMDEQIPWMNYAVFADDISSGWARLIKARYYGEISFIDSCVGRILDAVESRPDRDNTLICFFSDHGDHLGDHHAWQKESFFEQSCRIPFLVSWPERLPAGVRRRELVCLTDLFALATSASGCAELRDGTDILGLMEGRASPRGQLIGWYGRPGTRLFKVMVRRGDWKYIFMANGGREQLFNLKDDPFELRQQLEKKRGIAASLRAAATEAVAKAGAGAAPALMRGELRSFEYSERPRRRIYQFDASQGITGFPKRPNEVFENFPLKY